MLLFKTKVPNATAFDIRSVANVNHLIPSFNRDRHNLIYKYEKTMNMFHLSKNTFIDNTETMPRILSSFITTRRSPPHIGDSIEVKFQRRVCSTNPMMNTNGFHGVWTVHPEMSVAIVGINSYNTQSLLYEISSSKADQSFKFEMCQGFMLIVDNPEETTYVKFPTIKYKDYSLDSPFEDTLLVEYYTHPPK